MKVFEKIANITGCLEQMAWAWNDCEALPPWLRDMSERWGIRWFWVTKWLQGEARQLWLEMTEEERAIGYTRSPAVATSKLPVAAKLNT